MGMLTIADSACARVAFLSQSRRLLDGGPERKVAGRRNESQVTLFREKGSGSSPTFLKRLEEMRSARREIPIASRFAFPV